MPCTHLIRYFIVGMETIYTTDRYRQNDDLYEALNKYHENIKLTLEKNPSKFLDTKLLINNEVYEIQVNKKEAKLLTRWNSSIPKKHKRNAISVYLH